jgi:4'-phosphopantetheinyl transferase
VEPIFPLPIREGGSSSRRVGFSASGQVHLWLIDLDQPADPSCLSIGEWERAARLVFEENRARWVAGRVALREILAGYTEVDASALAFLYGPNGKPSFAGEGGISFNLSHSAKFAMLAVTVGDEIGVDIEAVRTDFDPIELGGAVFSTDEIQYLQDGEPATVRDRFFELWTLKEAWLKMLGCGLVDDLPTYSVLTGLPFPPTAAMTDLLRIDVADGYKAALATPTNLHDLRLYRYANHATDATKTAAAR